MKNNETHGDSSITGTRTVTVEDATVLTLTRIVTVEDVTFTVTATAMTIGDAYSDFTAVITEAKSILKNGDENLGVYCDRQVIENSNLDVVAEEAMESAIASLRKAPADR